jgi:hypothetical protein
MYFYRTFVYSNAQPTASAAKGLEYAVYLAPGDEELRIEAVRQLVSDNQIQQARELFKPIAYNIHSDLDWRKKKDSIMDALAANDRTAALQLLGDEIQRRWLLDKK